MDEKQTIINYLLETCQRRSEEIHIGYLGSCQYSPIAHAAELTISLYELGGHPLVREVLGVNYPLHYGPENFLDTLKEHFKEAVKSSMGDPEDLDDPEDILEYRELLTKIEAMALENTTDFKYSLWGYFHEYIEYTRGHAWDLWSAWIQFPEFESSESTPKSPTYGPILNQLAHSDNFNIGINLALWQIFIELHISSWADYDT